MREGEARDPGLVVQQVLRRGRRFWDDYAAEAESLLAQGKSADRAGAITVCRKIVANYPRTPAAEKARERLNELIAAGEGERVEARVTICPWKGNKAAAVSFTFDDAVPNQIKYHVPLLEARGFRGTFFVHVDAIRRGQRDNWEPWAELVKRGHEIGSHTISHPRLPELSGEQAERELAESKRIIGERVGVVPLTLAYTFAQHDDEVRRLTAKYYISARAGDVWVSPPTPRDLYAVPSFVPVTKTPASEMNAWVDAALETGGWVVEMIHGIEGQGWQPLPKQRYEEHFDYVYSLGSRLWVAPYVEVVKYVSERESAEMETREIGQGKIVLRLRDGLDDETYEEALTLRLEVPREWSMAEVGQGDSEKKTVRCVEEDDARVVYFDAVPDRGDIVVSSAGSPGT